MTRYHKAYIGLGSNIEPRAQTLSEAMVVLDDRRGIWVRRVSTLIETDPVGGPSSQGRFLNGVAEVETTLAPQALLKALHGVEERLGRKRSTGEHWGPRTCDLDLLMYDDQVLQSPELTLPHPLMHQRRFVLTPLAEIAGDAVHPVLGRTVRELLAELGGA